MGIDGSQNYLVFQPVFRYFKKSAYNKVVASFAPNKTIDLYITVKIKSWSI